MSDFPKKIGLSKIKIWGFLLIGSLLALNSMQAITKEISLAWDPGTESYVGGYRIYYGNASRNYTSMIDVGLQASFSIFDLQEDRSYYFAVTAYDSSQRVESGFSNEVSLLVNPVNEGGSKVVGSHESPSQGSNESGVGLIRGWVCNASLIEVEIDAKERLRAAYGTLREDTVARCGSAYTGYGLTYNWNLLGDGLHTLRVLADGVELDRVNFRVATFGVPYLQGITGEYVLPDFPETGNHVMVRWSEAHQNFVIVNPTISYSARSIKAFSAVDRATSSNWVFQESPSEGSYESGIGLIRGWVCNTSIVEIQIDGGERLRAAHGTRRDDAAMVCGEANVGYGLTYNWNRLGDGLHSLRVLADNVEVANVSFSVSTLGYSYLESPSAYTHGLVNFPSTGKTTTLAWSKAQQNFVILNVQ